MKMTQRGQSREQVWKEVILCMKGEHLSSWLTVKYESMETIGQFTVTAAMAISISETPGHCSAAGMKWAWECYEQ